MYRLGLRLILKGGREALVRLLLTTVAVAIGVTILLGVLADFHAYQKTSNRPSWESTKGVPISSLPSPASNALLWNYSENIYKGQFIEQLNVAALGSHAPILPGISKLPGPGQFYASPALAQLLKTVPKNELGNRFPGNEVGTIGESALSFPTELAIYVGRTPSEMAHLHGTGEVTNIARHAQLQGTTNIYKDAFGIAALAILFPLLILINTATRLAAARREERYAAMRLIGATPRQINVIASVDAIVSSLLGAALGCLIFVIVRPAIVNIGLSGVKFFPNYVTPTIWGYFGMLVGVPIVAAIASLVSLRRVQISPLGVSRKTTPKPPGAWRVIPLAAGVILFPYAASLVGHNGNGSPRPLLAGFLLIMIGIVLSGSWLTMQVTKLLARFARRAPSLLASRRLSDNPKGAYRTISGLVLAVFVGSVVAVLVPAFSYAQNPSGDSSLNNVLRVPYNAGPLDAGIPPKSAAKLVSKVESYPGTIVVPFYTNPAFTAFQQQQFTNGPILGKGISIQPGTGRINDAGVPDDNIVSCAALAKLSVLGSCPPGAKEVLITPDNVMNGDNPLFIYKGLPIVTHNNAASTANLNDLSLSGMLIKSNNVNTLEQIRTYLTVYNASSQHAGLPNGRNSLSAWQMGVLEPETVGEVAAIRNNDAHNVETAVFAVITLTLVTAGCSLAVTIGGSLVERKRSFTLLRVSGVSLCTLSEVILLEAALPLIFVSVIAAGIGVGVGIPAVRNLLKGFVPKGTNLPVHPSGAYYVTLGAGLAVALVLVLITLPLLSRMTKPEEARFE